MWAEVVQDCWHVTTRSAGSMRAEGVVQAAVLHDQDAVISQDAVAALKMLLEMQPQLLDVLFTSPEHCKGALDHADLVSETALNHRS